MSRIERLEHVLGLEPGWLDGEGGKATPQVATQARLFLAQLEEAGLTGYGIFPTHEGWVSFEWERLFIEITGLDDFNVIDLQDTLDKDGASMVEALEAAKEASK